MGLYIPIILNLREYFKSESAKVLEHVAVSEKKGWGLNDPTL